MASPLASPSRRSFRRIESPLVNKENALESPARHFGGKSRIHGLNSSPTPAPLDSFETFDSPTKDEISRTFGTPFAKILGKRIPLSPLATNVPTSPILQKRSKSSKSTIASAPTSPLLSSKHKFVGSPRRGPNKAQVDSAVIVAPVISNVKLEHEELALSISMCVEDPMDQSNLSVAAPMDISLAESVPAGVVMEHQERVLEPEPEPVYDEYGFIPETSLRPAVPIMEGGESLLRDESALTMATPGDDTSAWWDKWLSEGVARESESAFNNTLHPLRDSSGSPRQAVKDSWRPVAIGMVVQYGIPHHLRRRAWSALAKVESLQRKVLQSCRLAETPTSYYRTLLKSNNYEHQTWSRIIRLDLDRTFATHKLFRERGGEGQIHLSNVLTAYAHHNPAIGYCQGMSFVCATMLMIFDCDEVEAFWLLCAMMDAPEYSMCTYYSPGMQGLLADSAQLSNLLRMAIPQVHQHFAGKCNIDVVYFTARWWLSMFTDLGSWSTTLRIWDLFFAEGRSALHRISLSLLSLCKHDILSQDTLDGVLPYILNIPPAKLESSLLFQIVDETDLAQLELKFQYWQRAEQSKSQKKEQLEKLRKEKQSKASAPSTPGSAARSLFSRIWEKISTPSAAPADAAYKYTQLATSSPPRAMQMHPTTACSTSRAKRKRSDDSDQAANNGTVEALDLSDPSHAASFVNLNALAGRRIDFAKEEKEEEDILSPSKRRKLAEPAAQITRHLGESSLTVEKSEKDSFMAFATPTKQRKNW